MTSSIAPFRQEVVLRNVVDFTIENRFKAANSVCHFHIFAGMASEDFCNREWL